MASLDGASDDHAVPCRRDDRARAPFMDRDRVRPASHVRAEDRDCVARDQAAYPHRGAGGPVRAGGARARKGPRRPVGPSGGVMRPRPSQDRQAPATGVQAGPSLSAMSLTGRSPSRALDQAALDQPGGARRVWQSRSPRRLEWVGCRRRRCRCRCRCHGRRRGRRWSAGRDGGVGLHEVYERCRVLG